MAVDISAGRAMTEQFCVGKELLVDLQPREEAERGVKLGIAQLPGEGIEYLACSYFAHPSFPCGCPPGL